MLFLVIHLHWSAWKRHVSERPFYSKNIRMHHSFSMFMIIGDLECSMAENLGHKSALPCGGWGISLIYTNSVSCWEERDSGITVPCPGLKFSFIPLAELSFHIFYSLLKPLIQLGFPSWLGSILTLGLRQRFLLHLASVSSSVKWMVSWYLLSWHSWFWELGRIVFLDISLIFITLPPLFCLSHTLQRI